MNRVTKNASAKLRLHTAAKQETRAWREFFEWRKQSDYGEFDPAEWKRQSKKKKKLGITDTEDDDSGQNRGHRAEHFCRAYAEHL